MINNLEKEIQEWKIYIKDILKIDMSIEIWKDIPDYNDLYQASNWGRIKRLINTRNVTKEMLIEIYKFLNNNISPYKIAKSLGLSVTTIYNIKNNKIIYKEKILKASQNRNKYYHVTLSKNNQVKDFLIHKLILRTFVGIQSNEIDSRHLNGNKENNRLDNLKYGTRSENCIDAVSHQTSSLIKYSANDIIKVKELLFNNIKPIEIAKLMDMSLRHVYSIKNGERRKNV